VKGKAWRNPNPNNWISHLNKTTLGSALRKGGGSTGAIALNRAAGSKWLGQRKEKSKGDRTRGASWASEHNKEVRRGGGGGEALIRCAPY